MSKTLKEAAAFLGRTDRAVERYVSQGKLPARKEWRNSSDGKKRQVLIFEDMELQNFRSEMEAPKMRPKVAPIPPEQTEEMMFVGGRTKFSMSALEKAFAKAFKPSVVSLTDKLLLTFKEAAKISGLSERFLKSAASEGRLPVVEGVARGRRIKRDDLNKFVRDL